MSALGSPAPNINTGPGSPDYIDFNNKDTTQEWIINRMPTGSGNKGVVLTKDTLDIPLETQFGIHDERSESSRPTLMPLFRTRYVDTPESQDELTASYQNLVDSLPAPIKEALKNDMSQPFEERDANWIAFDNSLRFLAGFQNTVAILARPTDTSDQAQIRAQNYLQLPNQVKQRLNSYGTDLVNRLNNYLNQIGPNDPAHDLFSNVSSLIAQTIQHLS